MFFSAAETAELFRDVGDPASWQPSTGGPLQSGFATIDQPDQLYLGDMVAATAAQIKYPATQWLGLEEGQVVTVAGTGYRIKSTPMAEADGGVKRADVCKS